MRAKLSAFLRNESGATAIEYALIAAGIAIAIIGAVNGAGDALGKKFDFIKDKLTPPPPAAG
jgi:pilus assembly protein Flp/PilA